MQSQADQIKSQPRSESRQYRFDAGEALRMLSSPRLTGSQNAQVVSDELHGRFESLGYDVHDQRFVISTWPGRFAVSLAGFCYLLGALLAAGVLWAGHPGISVVLLLTVLLVVGAITVLVKPAMQIIRFGRVEASNLIATVPGKR